MCFVLFGVKVFAGSCSSRHQLSPHSTMAAQPLGSHPVSSWFLIISQSGVTLVSPQSFVHLFDDLHDDPVV